MELRDSIVSDNYARGGGGGIKIYSLTGSTMTISHSTVAGNTAAANGGVFYRAAELSVTNSIIWGNTPGELVECGETALSIDHSDVEGTGGAGGMGTIDEIPLFMNLLEGDLCLREGSPCIDSADRGVAPETDIDGNPRVTGSGGGGSGACASGGSGGSGGTGGSGPCPDMGAYEYQPSG